MVPITKDMKEQIEYHERLATIEELLRHIIKEQADRKLCDKDLYKKIDKILDNDKDKLQRITKNEVKIKNIKATLYLFVVPILAAVARSFA